MKRLLWIVTLGLLAVAVGLAAWGSHFPPGYVQGLLSNTATTFLGLAAAILFVNLYLASSEKGAAAAPLAKLIEPAIRELHNELFVTHLRNTFGIEKFRTLMDIYQEKNQRNPRAFSPEQCDEIHAAIMAKGKELTRVYDVLIDQFRELSMITGWSFDPSVTAAALEARLNFVKFKTLQEATDRQAKYQLIEAYFDGEAAASAVLEKLVRRLGLRDHQWKEDS
jgi:hypothetical protein